MARDDSPTLTAEVVADDQSLAEAIQELLLADRRWERHTQVILDAQSELRSAATDEAWTTYMDLEAATNARLGDALASVVRWAFEAGVESVGTES